MSDNEVGQLMVKCSNLLELNTRQWLNTFQQTISPNFKLIDIPIKVWKEFFESGFDYLWLMGIWETDPPDDQIFAKKNLSEEFNTVLPNWQSKDYVSSPYSIKDYTINSTLGETKELLEIKHTLNDCGLKLILDFVPNHFGRTTPLLKQNPQYFIYSSQKPEENALLYENIDDKWFFHGKDPYFDPWIDTFQLNYYESATRKLMADILLRIAQFCDGVRCDMAMLILTDIIEKTWGWYLDKHGYLQPETEFWKEAISKVKEHFPAFIFIAEAYWDLEWTLQQLGFDYTYDKRLYDRLRNSTVDEICSHLLADLTYQSKLVRFIENHDEPRAVVIFGKEKSLAAASIIGTLPGMRMYHLGQLDGNKIKYSLFLNRSQNESMDNTVQLYYKKLLAFSSHQEVQEGSWQLLDRYPVSDSDISWKNILSWIWKLNVNDKMSLVVVNYSSDTSQARIKINISDLTGKQDFLILIDEANNMTYKRDIKELVELGLYVKLASYQVHLFKISFPESFT